MVGCRLLGKRPPTIFCTKISRHTTSHRHPRPRTTLCSLLNRRRLRDRLPPLAAFPPPSSTSSPPLAARAVHSSHPDILADMPQPAPAFAAVSTVATHAISVAVTVTAPGTFIHRSTTGTLCLPTQCCRHADAMPMPMPMTMPMPMPALLPVPMPAPMPVPTPVPMPGPLPVPMPVRAGATLPVLLPVPLPQYRCQSPVASPDASPEASPVASAVPLALPCHVSLSLARSAPRSVPLHCPSPRNVPRALSVSPCVPRPICKR